MKHTLSSIAIILALAGCNAEPEQSKAEVVKVDGERIILGKPDKADFLKLDEVVADRGATLRLPGRLVWDEDRTVRVVPQVAGRVHKIAVEVGSSVKAGQVLAVLDSADFGLAQAEARKAQADLTLARQALERQRELHAAGVIADKDWQQTQAEAERASRRLALLGGDSDGTYVLRSPLAVVVVERNLNPGLEYRPDQAGEPLFVVTDPTSLWLQLDAGEADLAELKAGEPVRLQVKQYPEQQFSGVIRHVGDFVDPSSRTILVRGEVPNGERKLKGWHVRQRPDRTAAESRSPGARGGVPGRRAALRLRCRRFRKLPAAGGDDRPRARRQLAILSGLSAGEQVIVDGNLHLLKFFKAAPAQSEKAAK